MKFYGGFALFALAFFSSVTLIGFGADDDVFAQDIDDESIPLDRQVNLNYQQKRDPLSKRKEPKKAVAAPKNTSSDEKKVSYNGIWLVNRISDDCKSKINDFKIRINGKTVETVIGMNVQGRVFGGGQFEMNAKSPYWVIKFKGQLKGKTGLGKMTKVDTSNKTCSGAVGLTRIGN